MLTTTGGSPDLSAAWVGAITKADADFRFYIEIELRHISTGGTHTIKMCTGSTPLMDTSTTPDTPVDNTIESVETVGMSIDPVTRKL